MTAYENIASRLWGTPSLGCGTWGGGEEFWVSTFFLSVEISIAMELDRSTNYSDTTVEKQSKFMAAIQ